MNSTDEGQGHCATVKNLREGFLYLKYVLRGKGKAGGSDMEIPPQIGEMRSPAGASQAWLKIHWCVIESQE